MPTICKKDTCMNPAIYGFCFGKPLFCSTHREPNSNNTRYIEKTDSSEHVDMVCKQCPSKKILTRYKGYCNHCYIKTFPLDPLSLQTIYKSKDTIIQKFIDSKFDGFIHGPKTSQIQINGIIIQIVYNEEIKSDEKNIVIKFNPNKYVNGKNPMLYTRLPDLEKEIATQFERIVGVDPLPTVFCLQTKQ